MRTRFRNVLNRTLERRRVETAGEMTILEHLQELRRRITISIVAVLIAATVSFLFTDDLLKLLLIPATSIGIEVIAIAPAEVLTTYIKTALIVGLAIASPIVLSQIILFIAPGLTPAERRVLYSVLPLAIVFFFLGVLFAYVLVIPQALRFLFNFGRDIATPNPTISAYMGFVTALVLWMGLVFETPLIMGLLSWLDLVRHTTFARYRRFAIVGAFVLAAFITPTGDPVNLMLVATPIMILYEIGTQASRFVGRRPNQPDQD